MRNFHIQLLFQVASESYLIHCAASNTVLGKLTQVNSCGEFTFKKKLRNN